MCCLKVLPVSEECELGQCGVTGSLTCSRGPTALSASHSPGFLTGKHRGQHFTHLKHTDSHFPNKPQIHGIRSTYPSEWSPQQAQQPLSIPFLSMHLLIFPMHLIINCLTAHRSWLQRRKKACPKHKRMEQHEPYTALTQPLLQRFGTKGC